MKFSLILFIFVAGLSGCKSGDPSSGSGGGGGNPVPSAAQPIVKPSPISTDSGTFSGLVSSIWRALSFESSASAADTIPTASCASSCTDPMKCASLFIIKNSSDMELVCKSGIDTVGENYKYQISVSNISALDGKNLLIVIQLPNQEARYLHKIYDQSTDSKSVTSSIDLSLGTASKRTNLGPYYSQPLMQCSQVGSIVGMYSANFIGYAALNPARWNLQALNGTGLPDLVRY